MSAQTPASFTANRPARHQRVAWLLVLLAVLAAVPLMRYFESRTPATPKPSPPATPSTPAATAVPPGPVIQPPASVPSTPPVVATPSKPPSQQPPAKRPAPPQKSTTEKAAAGNASQAATPRAYRQDAAKHLYARNAGRIYKGKLQPLLYAIGVLQVSIDKQGRVRSLHWMRAPRHAPEVIREIERTVRAAAPYPAPARMGSVVYTDTWLWDKSGKFQLDTLTEGQL
ncbi:hypothetical protein SDC9_128960 [bioreactor metagenome]|uniref:TonB C-terminal domain-containing protein n=1 Tax=bioreactor metagenome TaxID=1076179 RepID=A0A645CYF2_9ZZZZ